MLRARAFQFAAILLLGTTAAEASIWPSSAQRVERELAAPEVQARRRAANALGELPRSVARRLVGVALADPDVEVRLAAAGAARELELPDLGQRLAAWLSDPEARIRLAAAEALRTRASGSALAALGRATSDADPQVRAAVARALGASESADAVVPLLGRLDDPVPEVRREIVSALGRLRDRRAVVPLLAKALDPAGPVRRAAARALGELGDPRAVSALVLVLRDTDETVRVAALDAIGRLGDASATSSVIAVLDDASPQARAAALGALARLGTPEAQAALVARLGRDTNEIEPVLRAVEHAGIGVVPALRRCIETQNGLAAADGCARALGVLGDASDVERIRAALERGAVSAAAGLAALGALGNNAALPPVLERLADSDPLVRVQAIFALDELLDPAEPDGRAVDPLLSAFRARTATAAERVALVRLLGRTGAPRAAPALAAVAREATAPALASAALSALGDLGPGRFDDVLLAGLEHADGSVRGAAALALRRAGSPAAAAKLLDHLERPRELDEEALGIALTGVVARSRESRLTSRIVTLLSRRRGPVRDALIEALSELPTANAGFAPLLASRDPADRRKAAEGLATRKNARGALRPLLRDRDGSVRAAAVWALGTAAEADDVPLLTAALRDPDAAVAANAAAALGRAGARSRVNVTAVLCASLADPRFAVRANALAALRLTRAGCAAGSVETLLRRDPAPAVRRAAARVLAASESSPTTRAWLARCAEEEDSADVAAACSEPVAPSTRFESVLVYVVPMGAADPLPNGSFSLCFADGSCRYGVADRRGAVYERSAPAGAVELGLTAAHAAAP
jgi:cellulose synthase operon protein C